MFSPDREKPSDQMFREHGFFKKAPLPGEGKIDRLGEKPRLTHPTPQVVNPSDALFIMAAKKGL